MGLEKGDQLLEKWCYWLVPASLKVPKLSQWHAKKTTKTIEA